MTKQELRTILKAKRKELDRAEALAKSETIIQRLLATDFYRQARVVMAYCSAFGEVDTTRLLEHLWQDGKTVYVPVCDVKHKVAYPVEISSMADLAVGAYGILEPKAGRRIKTLDADLILVPGIAFDRRGGRIGFGAGYYDKLLENAGGRKVALAYDFQIVEDAFPATHDVPMDCIMTESELIVCE